MFNVCRAQPIRFAPSAAGVLSSKELLEFKILPQFLSLCPVEITFLWQLIYMPRILI